MNHVLTVEHITHLCGGYQVRVRCACGYEGQEARVPFGCADTDQTTEYLDDVHTEALNRWQETREIPPPRQHSY